jgi:hypothetical protein
LEKRLRRIERIELEKGVFTQGLNSGVRLAILG